MKKLSLLFCALATMTTVLFGPGNASADVSAAVANCNGYTVVDAHYVVEDRWAWGSVQLCRDGDYYWGIYINYARGRYPYVQGAMPYGEFANVVLDRYYNGEYSTFTCDSPGGNVHVIPGQTWCRTPKIYAPSSNVTFVAIGKGYRWNGSKWVNVANGVTRECNRYIC